MTDACADMRVRLQVFGVYTAVGKQLGGVILSEPFLYHSSRDCLRGVSIYVELPFPSGAGLEVVLYARNVMSARFFEVFRSHDIQRRDTDSMYPAARIAGTAGVEELVMTWAVETRHLGGLAGMGE